MANKLNKPLIEKMIKRIEKKPETYFQADWARYVNEHNADMYKRPAPPCGTVACLAGEAVICSERSATRGIAVLHNRLERGLGVRSYAADLMGIDSNAAWGLFRATAGAWPEPYRTQHMTANDYKEAAAAAVNLLRAILRTDGKILEA